MADLGVQPEHIPGDYMLKHLHWILIIAMEKLVPIDNPRVSETMIQVIHQLFGEEYLNKLMHGDHNEYEEEDFQSINFLLTGLTYFADDIIKSTPHPQFRNALRLLKPLWAKWMPDTKSDNIMVRLTSTGPQLVFIDPVWSHPTGPINNNSYVLSYK